MDIQKICIYCKRSFLAQKTTTRYCSHLCNQRHYKELKKQEKIKASNVEYNKITNKLDIETIRTKEFLTAKETMFLLDISRTTLYRNLKNGAIQKVLGLKSIRIRRDSLYPKTRHDEDIAISDSTLPQFNKDNYYTINDVIKKYNVSGNVFENICKRNNIVKIPKGKFVYVPKNQVDKYFKENEDNS